MKQPHTITTDEEKFIAFGSIEIFRFINGLIKESHAYDFDEEMRMKMIFSLCKTVMISYLGQFARDEIEVFDHFQGLQQQLIAGIEKSMIDLTCQAMDLFKKTAIHEVSHA